MKVTVKYSLEFSCADCGKKLGVYHGESFVLEPVDPKVRIVCVACSNKKVSKRMHKRLGKKWRATILEKEDTGQLEICSSCIKKRPVYGYSLARVACRTSGPKHKLPLCRSCYERAEKDGLMELVKEEEK